MANKMLNIVLPRGRAYRCVPCGYVENKSRMEKHFYSTHVPEHQVPYVCKPCEFKTGDVGKFNRHQLSPNHLEKVPASDVLMQAAAYQISSVPRSMVVGEDVLRLSRDESSQHWLSAACQPVQDDETPPMVEDLRVQLLTTNEPFAITPPQIQDPVEVIQESREVPVISQVITEEKGTNTDKVTEADISILLQMDENIRIMNSNMSETLKQAYSYIETVSEMNKRQEAMIIKLEKRLDECEAREKREREERSREVERDRRVRDERSRWRENRRSRERKY